MFVAQKRCKQLHAIFCRSVFDLREFGRRDGTLRCQYLSQPRCGITRRICGEGRVEAENKNSNQLYNVCIGVPTGVAANDFWHDILLSIDNNSCCILNLYRSTTLQ
jgi:hypothetical protein